MCIGYLLKTISILRLARGSSLGRKRPTDKTSAKGDWKSNNVVVPRNSDEQMINRVGRSRFNILAEEEPSTLGKADIQLIKERRKALTSLLGLKLKQHPS